MPRWKNYKQLAQINYDHHMANLKRENQDTPPMATTMTDESPMPFGKYKGQKLKHVPADYLLWMWDNGPELHRQQGGLADYIRASFSALEQECPDKIIVNRPDVPRSKKS